MIGCANELYELFREMALAYVAIKIGFQDLELGGYDLSPLVFSSVKLYHPI